MVMLGYRSGRSVDYIILRIIFRTVFGSLACVHCHFIGDDYLRAVVSLSKFSQVALLYSVAVGAVEHAAVNNHVHYGEVTA